MTDRQTRATPASRIPDMSSEQRLSDIRREAELHGAVKADGIHPPGAPFPVASEETGYYGIPLLKEPAWTWEIPLYFFVGGAAGAAAVVGAIASYTGADRKLVRDAQWIAAAGTVLSPALLVADLGLLWGEASTDHGVRSVLDTPDEVGVGLTTPGRRIGQGREV
ncbi:MAG: hypothetical protein ACHP8A_09665, partial [Terriglobales bacterium]